jgi:hypothetical protein
MLQALLRLRPWYGASMQLEIVPPAPPPTPHPRVFKLLGSVTTCLAELWDGVDRHHFNAIVSEQDVVDTYLPAFQSCVGTLRVPACVSSARKFWAHEELRVGE